MTADQPDADIPFLEVAKALTEVARRLDSHGEPCDFADFLAGVLAATAANVGGPEALLAGRRGSWEASYVASLLCGTMGDEPADWQRFRTEPIVVPLNIAELIESGDHHQGLAGLDDVIESIEGRYESDESEFGSAAYRSESESAVVRYTEAYRSYGSRFEAAVREAAHAHGVAVEVVVEIDDDPQSRWWADEVRSNPLQWAGDELIFEIWCEAHDGVPLPNVDIRLDPPMTHQCGGGAEGRST